MAELSLREIQKEQKEWADRNFPDADTGDQLFGVMEELGEIAHSFLKLRQGIRGTKQEHLLAIEDGVADLTIFLCGFCSVLGIDYQRVLNEVWENVKRRDWQKNKQTGEV